MFKSITCTYMIIRFCLVLALLVCHLSLTATAALKSSDLVSERALTDYSEVTPGQKITVAVEFQLDEGWHIYWENPGQSGMPTLIQWSGPQGITFGPMEYPVPYRFDEQGMATFGYKNRVIFLSTVEIPTTAQLGTTLELNAKSSWLVCKELCIPGKGTHTLRLKVASKTKENPEGMALINAERKLLPIVDERFKLTARVQAKSVNLEIVSSGPILKNAEFYPAGVLKDEIGIPGQAAPQKNSDRHLSIATPFNSDAILRKSGLIGVLRIETDSAPVYSVVNVLLGEDIPASNGAPKGGVPLATADGAEKVTLLTALFAAFVGGLILNIMPCVLPVIALKIFSFVQTSGNDRHKSFKLGAFFSAGVLVSMWTMALAITILKASGKGVLWGSQFQSPIFIFILCTLCVVFALNLFGVFEVTFTGGQIASNAVSKSGASGAFFNGALAVVLGIPCSAPILGTALSFAFSQPIGAIWLIFTFIGIGLFAPYLVLSARPEWLRFLPKPGNWMVYFKQALALPLFLTAAWLVWVYTGLRNKDEAAVLLCVLIGVSFGLWIFGKLQFTKPLRGMLIAAVVTLMVSWFALNYFQSLNWESWSPEKEAAAVSQGEAVFIDFTADWCQTCKANEKLVIGTKNVMKAFADKKVRLFKADWTKPNPDIDIALQKYGRAGIPMYLYYPGGKKDPILLPEIITKNMIINLVNEK